MMIKYKYIWQFLCYSVILFNVTINAQERILLQSNVLKIGDTIVLEGFNKGKSMVIDTFYVAKEGDIAIVPKNKLNTGMYSINVPSAIYNGEIQILIDKEAKKDLLIRHDQKNNTILFDNDQNQTFLVFLETAQESYRQLNELRDSWRIADLQNKDKITDQISNLEEKLFNLGKQTSYAYKGTLLSEIIDCNNPQPVNGRNLDYFMNKEKYEKVTKETRTTYWDGVDFSNSQLLSTPFLYSKINQYTLFFNTQDSKLDSIIDELLNKTLINPDMFEVMTDALYSIYNKPGSNRNNQDITLKILNKALEQTYVPDWKKFSIKEQIKIIEKNKIGSKANDISLKDSNDQSHLLSAFKAEYTLLYFYDPDCHSCAKATPMVKQWIKTQKKLSVWGIYIEQDKKLWQKYVETNESPVNWINLWDENGKDKLREKYWIDGIPAMYLLDKNKNVILKNVNFSQLKTFFMEH